MAASYNIMREEIKTLHAMLGASEEIKTLYATLEARRAREEDKSKSAASNITIEDIERPYDILGESDDFFRTVSKEKKNRCPWEEGETGFCGKPCVGPSCFKHMLMGLAGHKPPLFVSEDWNRHEKRPPGTKRASNDDWHVKTSGINASGN